MPVSIDAWGCQELAVPAEIMRHVVQVESSNNPFAIGVVGTRLQRQPRTLGEAVATARMLEGKGYNFSLGLAQVNRHNLAPYGLASYEQAFSPCQNLAAGARILAECHARSGQDWPKSFSCYYAGDFKTGFRHGYVRKVMASMLQGRLEPAGSRVLAKTRGMPAVETGVDAGSQSPPVPQALPASALPAVSATHISARTGSSDELPARQQQVNASTAAMAVDHAFVF